MSSTDLEAPPLRLILIAIILVVGLHLLTAIALVIIKAPTLKDEPIKETPPLEIQMVTLPTEPIENVVTEVEEVPQSKAESIPTPKPEPKPEPKTQQKMKAVTPVDPVVREEEPIVQKEKPVQTPPIKEPPVKKKIEDKPPVIDKSVADEQRRIIAAQAEKTAQQAERQAQAKALQEAQAQAARDAQAQADANAAKEAAQKAAQAKAEREAEAAARAKQRLQPKLRLRQVMSLSILPPVLRTGHRRQTLAFLTAPLAAPVREIRSTWCWY